MASSRDRCGSFFTASYIINGAKLLRMDDQIGTLEAGKLADLIVLESETANDHDANTRQTADPVP